ncbi:hypothetical protein HYFRA_00002935 [Hymenoscyphus fraxineus]|uniref:RING-type domain-containing protein n=1 Tax=Hymenoscyphus fraxineus TaxID=746836 RepID=A0A9N9KNS3_9HELO|nr:hypothetical protein HYFRA_00002935 [Hymenoscyphus fraxineus]
MLKPDKIMRAENTWCGHSRCKYMFDKESNRVDNDPTRLRTRLDRRRDIARSEFEMQRLMRPELQIEEDMKTAMQRAINQAAYKKDLLKPENQGPDFHVLDVCKLADGKLDQVLPGLLVACTPTPSPTPTPSGELEPDDCAICSEPMMPDEDVAHLPCSRKHQFHRRCIINYLKLQKSCPMCRTEWKIYCFGGFEPPTSGFSMTDVVSPPPTTPFRQPCPVQVGGFIQNGARESEQRQMLVFESTAALADIWGERNDPAALQQERNEWQREQDARVSRWQTRLETATAELIAAMQEQEQDLTTLQELWDNVNSVRESADSGDLTARADALALELLRGDYRRAWLTRDDIQRDADSIATMMTDELLDDGVLESVGYAERRDREDPQDLEILRVVLAARQAIMRLTENTTYHVQLNNLQNNVGTWIYANWEQSNLEEVGVLQERAQALVAAQEENERNAAADSAQRAARDLFRSRQAAAAAAAAAQQQPGEQQADGQPDPDIQEMTAAIGEMDADTDQEPEVPAQELEVAIEAAIGEMDAVTDQELEAAVQADLLEAEEDREDSEQSNTAEAEGPEEAPAPAED